MSTSKTKSELEAQYMGDQLQQVVSRPVAHRSTLAAPASPASSKRSRRLISASSAELEQDIGQPACAETFEVLKD